MYVVMNFFFVINSYIWYVVFYVFGLKFFILIGIVFFFMIMFGIEGE